MTKKILPFSVFEEKYDADIGLDKDTQKIVSDFLKTLQSDSFILFVKIWNFHWNVISKRFNPTHEFFNKLYDKFFDRIDEIAERIREIGGRPIGSLSGFLNSTELKEYKEEEEVPNEKDMFKMILTDYETIIKNIRKFLEEDKCDNGTTNFLEDLIMKMEKDAWILRSHLEE